MQRIPIKFATQGMILAKSASRADGMILAGENMVLTDAMVDLLKKAEIPSLVVKGRHFPDLPSGVDLTRVRERVPHLFRKYKDDKLMMAMRKVLEQCLARAVQTGEEERGA